MDGSLDELMDVLSAGLVDPDFPAVLHPNLRREFGAAIEGRFRAEGVTPALLNSVAATFERVRGEMGAAAGAPDLVERLRELVRHSYQPVYPFLATFLRLALHRVNGAEQWHGLLVFLDRTAVLMTLAAGSGSLPAPAPPLREPEPVQPGARFCMYCGWPGEQAGGAFRCQSCDSVRPAVPPDSTLIRCGACEGFTPAFARYCEWCGREFAH